MVTATRRLALLGSPALLGSLALLAGCGGGRGGGTTSSTTSASRPAGLVSPSEVVSDFREAGIVLAPYLRQGGAEQLMGYDPHSGALNVIVDILPSLHLTLLSSGSMGIDGNPVHSIRAKNVLVWISAQAPPNVEMQVQAAFELVNQ
jgi:hypothetical protein